MAVCVSASLVAGPASAGAAPLDRTKPVLSGLHITPINTCSEGGSGDSRKVTFTLSEPATVKLWNVIVYYGIPVAAGLSGRIVKLPAGPNTVWTGRYINGGEPAFGDYDPVTGQSILGFQPIDAASNGGDVRWTPMLSLGTELSSHSDASSWC